MNNKLNYTEKIFFIAIPISVFMCIYLLLCINKNDYHYTYMFVRLLCLYFLVMVSSIYALIFFIKSKILYYAARPKSGFRHTVPGIIAWAGAALVILIDNYNSFLNSALLAFFSLVIIPMLIFEYTENIIFIYERRKQNGSHKLFQNYSKKPAAAKSSPNLKKFDKLSCSLAILSTLCIAIFPLMLYWFHSDILLYALIVLILFYLIFREKEEFSAFAYKNKFIRRMKYSLAVIELIIILSCFISCFEAFVHHLISTPSATDGKVSDVFFRFSALFFAIWIIGKYIETWITLIFLTSKIKKYFVNTNSDEKQTINIPKNKKNIFKSQKFYLLCIFCFVAIIFLYGNIIVNRLTINRLYKEGGILKIGNWPVGEESPIEWEILKIKYDGTAILLSKNIIDLQPYNNDKADITWENCSLRKWLNDEFYNNAFKYEELGIIINTHLKNPSNKTKFSEKHKNHLEKWSRCGEQCNKKAEQKTPINTPGGNDTDDNVWLLSINEIKKYISSEAARQAKPLEYLSKTNYCGSKGCPENEQHNYCDFSDNCKKDKIEGTGWWWLRSPGDAKSAASHIHHSGFLNNLGRDVNHTEGGVRPAIRIDLLEFSKIKLKE